METLLVTGGCGFIGSAAVLQLLKSPFGPRVINLDALTYAGNPENLRSVQHHPRYRFIQGDICDRNLLKDLFQETKIDGVLHLAAETHVDRAIKHPELFARTNVMGTLALLEAARQAWQEGDGYRSGTKFLLVSTDEVYGTLGSDGSFTEHSPLSPRSPYSASKASAELIALSYHASYGFPVCTSRSSNNYGPRQFPEKLIPMVITNALAHKPIPVYGSGLQVRDWIYVEDHCKALMLILKNGIPGRSYNIGANCERTNLDLVTALLLYLGENVDPAITPSLIQHVQDRPGHDFRYALDIGRIHRELGWTPNAVFEEELATTVDWYLSNQNGWSKP